MTAPPRNRPAALRLVDKTTLGRDVAVDTDDRDLDWSILMARAQTGDGVAYRRLLAGVTPYLRSLAARRHRDARDQEDAVQDILLTVHAIRHTYDPTRPFAPWLAAIANRQLVDRLRRQGRRNLRETALTEQHDWIGAEPVEGIDPSDQRALHAALAALPPGQQRALRLLKLEEMSLKEAEAASGLSIATLKVTVHRALKTMRRLLTDRSRS